MIRSKYFYIEITIGIVLCLWCKRVEGQDSSSKTFLNLRKKIALAQNEVQISGMAVNYKEQVLYVTATKNRTVEVIDLQSGKDVHTISCNFHPHLICYIPQFEEVFVTSDGGKCYFYSTQNFKCTGTVHVLGQPTAIRYDSVRKKIYVGYEYDAELGGLGGITIFDAEKHKKENYLLFYGPPEEMWLSRMTDKLYVNIPSISEVDVVDLEEHRVGHKWQTASWTAALMAVDNLENSLFLYYPKHSTLAIINAKTGKTRKLNTDAKHAKNFFFDSLTRQLFVHTKQEEIYTFCREKEYYKQTSHTEIMGNGAALFIPLLRTYIVVNQNNEEKKTDLIVYEILRF